MTPQLESIRLEIKELDNYQADIQMLDGLTNNLIYVLSTISRDKQNRFDKVTKERVNSVLSDVLHTLNRELQWAGEEDDANERRRWFVKAKRQVLQDLQPLF